MPFSPFVLALAAAVISFAAPPGASSVSITVQHGKIYQTAKAGDPTQGFLQIHNSGDADTLTAANCPLADTTSLVGPGHQPIINLAIPANSDVALAANGPHLQLTGTHFPIQFGAIIPCSLTFKSAGVISVFLFAVPAP
ncbi:MAG: copper chaperone PCu(A)C [Acidocella sp.]|nr:copper chaperone PCu(A)C [Acidocella sp.]